MKTETRRYSEAFQQQVVRELEAGKFRSINQARKAYGIGSGDAIRVWVLRHGNPNLHPKIIRVESMKERDQKKEDRARIRELEAALADAHIDHTLSEAYLRLACERLGTEPVDFKKNTS